MLSGAVKLLQCQLRQATIAQRIDIVGLQPNGAIVQFDGLLDAVQVQQGIAEVGQGHREARLQRDGPLQVRARFLILPKCEMRSSQIGKGVCRARVDGHGMLESLSCFLQVPTRKRAQSKQMQSAEMIRKLIQDLTAEYLRLRISALIMGCDRGGEDGVRLLLEFLLQSRVVERARSGAALQSCSPTDGPRRV